MSVAIEVAKPQNPSPHHVEKSHLLFCADQPPPSRQSVPAKPSGLSPPQALTCSATRGRKLPGLRPRRRDDCARPNMRRDTPAVHARGQRFRVRPRLRLAPAIWRHLRSPPQPRCRPHYMKTDVTEFLLGNIKNWALCGSSSVKPSVLCGYRFESSRRHIKIPRKVARAPGKFPTRARHVPVFHS